MNDNSFTRKVIEVTLVIGLIALFWTYRHWFLLALLAIIVAVGLSIPTNALRKRGLKRGLAVAVSATGFFVLMTVLSLWIVPTFVTQSFVFVQSIPKQFPALSELIDESFSDEFDTTEQLPNSESPMPKINEEAVRNTKKEAGISNKLQLLWQENKELISQAMTILPRIFRGAKSFAAVIGQIILTMFLALLLLATPYSYINASLFLVPKESRNRLLEIWQSLYKTLTIWLSALSFSISITIALVWIILGLVLGMPNALLAAVIAGIATFIPNIGTFIPILPIVVFSISAEHPNLVFLTVPAYLLIQLVESNILTPLVVKAELNLPPAATLFFQIISGLLFGFLGVLMAVPILAILITLVRELYSVDFLGYKDDMTTVAVNSDGKLILVKAIEKRDKRGVLSFMKRRKSKTG